MQRHQLRTLLLTVSFGFVLPESALGHRKDAGYPDRREVVCSGFHTARVNYCKKHEYADLCGRDSEACEKRCNQVAAPETQACKDKKTKYCDYYSALTAQLIGTPWPPTSVSLGETAAQQVVDKCEDDDKAAAKADAERAARAHTPPPIETTLVVQCKKNAYLATTTGSNPPKCADASLEEYAAWKADKKLSHFTGRPCTATLTAALEKIHKSAVKSNTVDRKGELSECPADEADAKEEAKYHEGLANKKSAIVTCEGKSVWLAEKKDGEPESCLKIEWKRYVELKRPLSVRALRKEFKNAGDCPWPVMDKMYVAERGKEAQVFTGDGRICSSPSIKPGELGCYPPNVWDKAAGSCVSPTNWLKLPGIDLIIWLIDRTPPAYAAPLPPPPIHTVPVPAGKSPVPKSDITGIPEDRAKRKEVGPVTPTPTERKIDPPKGFGYAKPPSVHTPETPTPTVHVPKVPTPAPTPPTVRPPSEPTPIVSKPEVPVRAPTITGPGDRVGGVKADVKSKGKEEDLAAERDEVLKMLKKPER